MSELDTAERRKLRRNQFAYVDGEGVGHLPINDESHVRNAISRWDQTDFGSKAARERARRRIVAAAKRHGIDVSDDDEIIRAAR